MGIGYNLRKRKQSQYSRRKGKIDNLPPRKEGKQIIREDKYLAKQGARGKTPEPTVYQRLLFSLGFGMGKRRRGKDYPKK